MTPTLSPSELREIEGFGDKTFEQAAGFLRIKDGDNPLDRTGVHPESYPIVEKIAASLNGSIRPLGGIGRRNGFKIHRPHGHIGSTPIEATFSLAPCPVVSHRR